MANNTKIAGIGLIAAVAATTMSMLNKPTPKDLPPAVIQSTPYRFYPEPELQRPATKVIDAPPATRVLINARREAPAARSALGAKAGEGATRPLIGATRANAPADLDIGLVSYDRKAGSVIIRGELDPGTTGLGRIALREPLETPRMAGVSVRHVEQPASLYAWLLAAVRVKDQAERDAAIAQVLTRFSVTPSDAAHSPPGAGVYGVVNHGRDITSDDFLEDQRAIGAPMYVAIMYGARGTGGRVQRFVEASDRPVLVVVVFDEIDPDVLDVARHRNCAGIVLGHAISADEPIARYSQWRDTLIEQARVIRAVANVPLLLSVSWVNVTDREGGYQPEAQRAWTGLFADVQFDGYIVHNINGFAWWGSNGLTSTREKLGLPADKPVILFEFIGSRKPDAQAHETWERYLPLFRDRLASEGWAGCVLYGTNLDDAVFKGDLIKQIAR